MQKCILRMSALLLCFILCLSSPLTVFAGVIKKGGHVAGSSSSTETQDQTENAEDTAVDVPDDYGAVAGAPGAPYTIVPSAIPSDLDLESAVGNSGLNDLGEGNTPPDSILGVTPFVTYALQNEAGTNLSFTSSHMASIAYFPTGFSKFWMSHNGVGRYYYRVYSDKYGWSAWCNSKQSTPINDDGTKAQAIQIRVKGYTRKQDNIFYRVVLNDGTVLDWARDGQTTGTMGTDRYIVAIKVALWNTNNEFPGKTQTLMESGAYEGIYYDPEGNLKYSTFDGREYTGWAVLDNTYFYFINNVLATGWQYIDGFKYYFNEDGTLCTDLEPVMGLTGDYQINYNIGTRTMYIMAKDGANGYIIPFKTFNSACGPTPTGTFSTYAKYDVKFMHDNIYCKYLSRFYSGYLIHSVLYYGSGLELDAITYNYIDDAISGGCIRLPTGDAFWVYSNCPMHTTVNVYNDPWNKGPVEKPAVEQVIPRDQTWDPTDPVIVRQQQAAAAAEAAAAEAAAAEAAAAEAAAAAASQDAIQRNEDQVDTAS